MSKRQTRFSEAGQRSLSKYGTESFGNPSNNYGSPRIDLTNQYNQNNYQDPYAEPMMSPSGMYPQYQSPQPLNQFGRYNQQQLYQQQMYLEQQNQQIVSLLMQQEQLKKELEDQKLNQKRDKYRHEYINRELEREALDLLDDFEFSLGSPQSRNPAFRVNPLSKSTPIVSTRPIVTDQAANMIYPDKPQQSNLSDVMLMMMMSERMRQQEKPPENKASQLLMASLDKQSRVLEKLTGFMGVEKEREYAKETDDLVGKIKQLENQNFKFQRKLIKKERSMEPPTEPDLPDPLKL